MMKATFELIGRIGTEIEFKTTANGEQAAFKVVTEHSYLSQGVQKKDTDWHRVICFKANLMNYLRIMKKGAMVVIKGRIKQAEWTDANGQKQYSTNLEIVDIHYIGFVTNNHPNQGQNTQGQAPQNQGGYNKAAQNQGGQNTPPPPPPPPQNQGGYNNQAPQNQGGYNNQAPQNQGGYNNQAPQNQGGYNNQAPQNQGGYNNQAPQNQGGYNNQAPQNQGGYNNQAPQNQGGFEQDHNFDFYPDEP